MAERVGDWWKRYFTKEERFFGLYIFVDNKAEGVLHKLAIWNGIIESPWWMSIARNFLPWDYLSSSFTDFFLASTWLSMGADPKLPLLALAEKIGTRGCLTGFTWTLRMLELLWLFGGFLKWWYPTTIPWDSVYPNMIFIWMIPGIRVHQQMALISMVVCWPFILVYLMMPNYAYIWWWFVQCGKVDAWWCRPFTFHKENDEPIYGA